MKKIVMILGVLIFGMWSCSKDQLTDPSISGNANADPKKSEVKTFVLKAIKLQNHPTSTPGVYSISGNMSHLGLIDPQSTLTMMPLGPDPDNPGTVFQSAVINMIGADGSSIHFISIKATFSFVTGYGEQEWNIDSGTGRFAGATGWYKSISQYDFTAAINNVTGFGEIYINK
jgi:hypothetical protein